MSPILRGQKYFHRFVRINYALPHIQKSMEDMQLLEEADADYDSSSNQTKLPYKICKRIQVRFNRKMHYENRKIDLE